MHVGLVSLVTHIDNLEATDKKDVSIARADLQSIIAKNPQGYDVRAAVKLLSELPNE